MVSIRGISAVTPMVRFQVLTVIVHSSGVIFGPSMLTVYDALVCAIAVNHDGEGISHGGEKLLSF